MPEKIQYRVPSRIAEGFWQLDVSKLSVSAAMERDHLSKAFPKEEMYSLTDQIRKSSRSISGQIAEGFRRTICPFRSYI